jgi:hypothetical protein
VHFGLLQQQDIERLEALKASIPMSRKLLAVPFVGKDVPSRASEFSHPDVLIGLTILAYRYEGLRERDLHNTLREMQERMIEETGPFPDRPSCRTFERWILCTGKRVRGSKAPSNVAPLQLADGHSDLISTGKLGAQSLFSLTQAQSGQDPTSVWHFFEDDEDIWPLQLVDRTDSEQMGVLFPLLAGLPHTVQYYLNEIVFPEMLAHQVRHPSSLIAFFLICSPT